MNATLLAAIVASAAPDASASAASDPDVVGSAIELTYAPEQRERGIAQLQAWVREQPDDRRARHGLARALAWSGRHDEALEHYDRLLAVEDAEAARALERERLEVLTWKGEIREALRGYRSIVQDSPDDADARLGMAKTLRWRGRPLAARWHARKALASSTEHEDAARHELAWSHAAVGHPGAARRSLGEHAPSEELASELRRLERPHVGTMLSAAGNSFDIQRVALRSAIRIPLPHDIDLELGSGMTHLQQGETQMSYGVAGLALSAAVDRLELRAGAGAYGAADHHGVDGHARASVQVVDELQVSFGYRHRPLLENTPPESTAEATYHGAGVGNVQVLDATTDIEVDQITAGLNIVPGPWAYVYAEGTHLWVDDGNRGFTVSTGAGADILGYWKHWPVRLFARWDVYVVGFDETRTAYFAPDLLDVHSVGLDLRVRVWKLELGGTGGGTFPLFTQAATGYYAGGAIALATEHVAVALRGDHRADAFFEQWRAWLSIDVPF